MPSIANPHEETTMQTAKEQARQLLDQLPDNATLNDIRYELNDALYTLYVRQQIELGLQDAREGRTIPHDEVRKRFSNGKR
jgi:predicted transcriptional regulator